MRCKHLNLKGNIQAAKAFLNFMGGTERSTLEYRFYILFHNPDQIKDDAGLLFVYPISKERVEKYRSLQLFLRCLTHFAGSHYLTSYLCSSP
jgi:hypothetical protein